MVLSVQSEFMIHIRKLVKIIRTKRADRDIGEGHAVVFVDRYDDIRPGFY
jgi:ribosomal protein L31E